MQGRAMCWVGYISLFTLVFVTCEDPLTRRQTGSVRQRHLPILFPLLPFSFSHILHFCHFLLLFTPSLYSTLLLFHYAVPPNQPPLPTHHVVVSTFYSLLYSHITTHNCFCLLKLTPK